MFVSAEKVKKPVIKTKVPNRIWHVSIINTLKNLHGVSRVVYNVSPGKIALAIIRYQGNALRKTNCICSKSEKEKTCLLLLEVINLFNGLQLCAMRLSNKSV